MAEHRKTPPARALVASVKAMNDTLGPGGLARSALIFGEVPRVYEKSETPSDPLTLRERP